MPSPSPIPTPEPHLSVHLTQNLGEHIQCEVHIEGRKVFAGVSADALASNVKVSGATLHSLGDVAAEFGVDLDEPDDRCPHDIYDRGDGTVSECSLPKGHAPTVHDSGDGVMWTDGEHWKDEESNLDDLPGEPVEPSDLRAGDKVEFTYRGGRITSTLLRSPFGMALFSDTRGVDGCAPNVVFGGEWERGVSDVRLIERAPRDPGQCEVDGSLAKALRRAHATGDWLDVARVAREHIGAEQEDAEATTDYRTGFAMGQRSVLPRAEQAEAERDALRDKAADLRERLRVTELDGSRRIVSLRERVEKAEAERDEWKAQYEALRADVEREHVAADEWSLPSWSEAMLARILNHDDKRAKGKR